MRWMITDELWDILGPLVEQTKQQHGGQQPVLPDRLFLEALLYLDRTATLAAGTRSITVCAAGLPLAA
jgi:hypothetical protein